MCQLIPPPSPLRVDGALSHYTRTPSTRGQVIPQNNQVNCRLIHPTPPPQWKKTPKTIIHIMRKRSPKGKVRPITGHEGPEGEYRYSSTLSLTSTLDGETLPMKTYTGQEKLNARSLSVATSEVHV